MSVSATAHGRVAAAGVALGLAWLAQVAGTAEPAAAWLVWVGAGLATVYFACLWPGISALGRTLLLLIPVLGGLALWWGATGDLMQRAAASGLLMTAFVAAMSTLRIAASVSPLMHRCGTRLLAQPPGRAYAVMALGAMLSASVLLFGVVNLFGAMIARAGGTGARARRAMSAVLRGYAMMPVWSPIALPFGLVAVHYPSIDWLALLPLAGLALVVLGGVGVWADRREHSGLPELPPSEEAALTHPDLMRLLLLVVALMAGIAAGAAWLGWPVIRAAVLFVPLAAGLWLWRVRAATGSGARPRALGSEAATGLAAERSILAVMCGAGACGVLLGSLLPVDAITETLRAAALPVWAVPALCLLLFVGLGQVGFAPTLTFLTLAVVLPDPAVLGLAPPVFFAMILAAWGLTSVLTPFSVPALVTARLFDTTAAAVVYRWSPRYLVVAPLGLALLFGLLAVLLPPAAATP